MFSNILTFKKKKKLLLNVGILLLLKLTGIIPYGLGLDLGHFSPGLTPNRLDLHL